MTTSDKPTYHAQDFDPLKSFGLRNLPITAAAMTRLAEHVDLLSIFLCF